MCVKGPLGMYRADAHMHACNMQYAHCDVSWMSVVRVRIIHVLRSAQPYEPNTFPHVRFVLVFLVPGHVLQRLVGHTDRLARLAFHPMGKHVVRQQTRAHLVAMSMWMHVVLIDAHDWRGWHSIPWARMW